MMTNNPNNDYLIQSLEKQRKFNENLIKCPECGCTWLCELQFAQYGNSMQVVIGQSVVPESPIFKLLICARCLIQYVSVIEPPLIRQLKTQEDKKYDEFYDEINSEIKSEKL